MSELHLIFPPDSSRNPGRLAGRDSDARLITLASRQAAAVVVGSRDAARYAERSGVRVVGRCGSLSRVLVGGGRPWSHADGDGEAALVVPRSMRPSTRAWLAGRLGVRVAHAPRETAVETTPPGPSDPDTDMSLRAAMGLRADELVFAPGTQPVCDVMARRVMFIAGLLGVAGVPARVVLPATARALPEAITFAHEAEQPAPLVSRDPLPLLWGALDAVLFDWSLDARATGRRPLTHDEQTLVQLVGGRAITLPDDLDHQTPTAASRLPRLAAAVIERASHV